MLASSLQLLCPVIRFISNANAMLPRCRNVNRTRHFSTLSPLSLSSKIIPTRETLDGLI